MPHNKILKLKDNIDIVLNNAQHLKMECVARVLGLMVSSLPAVQYDALHYRDLEMDKIGALQIQKGTYNRTMSIFQKGKDNRQWWLDNVETSFCDIGHPPVDAIIYLDASMTGWGAVMGEIVRIRALIKV